MSSVLRVIVGLLLETCAGGPPDAGWQVPRFAPTDLRMGDSSWIDTNLRSSFWHNTNFTWQVSFWNNHNATSLAKYLTAAPEIKTLPPTTAAFGAHVHRALPWWHRSDAVTSIFKCNGSNTCSPGTQLPPSHATARRRPQVYACWKWPSLHHCS